MTTPGETIPMHYFTMFRDNVIMGLNNGGSLLIPHIDVDTGYAGDGASPVISFGNTRGQEKTDRYGDTPIMDVDRSRRWVYPKTFEWGTLLDNDDQLSMMIDPASPLVAAAVEGLGEDLDYEYIVPQMLGAATIGRDGQQTTVGYDTTMTVGVQVGDPTPADTGMNVAKIVTARYNLQRFKALRKLKPGEKPKMAMTALQEKELLQDAQAIHGDYIVGRPLATGDLPALLNFDFIIIEDLPLDGNGDRECPYWIPQGVKHCWWEQITVHNQRDPGKRYNWRPYMAMRGGTVRIREKMVGKVLCAE